MIGFLEIESRFSLAVLSILLALVAILYFRHRKNQYSSFPGFQTSPWLTFFTIFIVFRHHYFRNWNIHSHSLLFQSINGVHKLFEKEKIAHVWILNRPAVLFYKPDTIEVLLSKRNSMNKSKEYEFFRPAFGDSILLREGDDWRQRRKILNSAFHSSVLQDFMPIFDEQSRVLVSKLRNLRSEPWVDIVPIVTMCTLDIICQTAMGVDINAQNACSDDIAAFIELQDLLGSTLFERVMKPWFWFDAIFYRSSIGRKIKSGIQHYRSFTEKIVKEKKQKMLESYAENNETETKRNPGECRRPAFLELLLKLHLKDNLLTEEDIYNETITFLLAGQETTSTAIYWALYNLGLYPEIQEKVLQELDSIFGDDLISPVTREDIRQMKYLECVLKETLRLYPSIPIIARENKEDFNVLDYTVPAGSLCVVNFFMLHRDPESFPNPEKFQPERFFPENTVGRHPFAFAPFSAGPRVCIGQTFAMMEGKTILANILRHFRVESLDQRDKMNLFTVVSLRCTEPEIRLRFIERKSHHANHK